MVSLLEWDVATGSSRTVPLPVTATQDIRYTEPSGAALLVQTAASNNVVTLERRSLDGSLQLSYGALGAGHQDWGIPFVSTPDGRNLVIMTPAGLSVVSNGGAEVRTLPAPPGNPSCTAPMRWWGNGSILAVCQPPNLPNGPSVPNLWLFHLSGAAPTALTKAPEDGHNTGFVNAWRFSGGTILERGAACGFSGLATLNASDTGDDLKLNVAVPNEDSGPRIQSVVGDTAFVTVDGCGPTAGLSLIGYDLVAKKPTDLLGPGVNGGTVVSELVIDHNP